MNLRDSNIKMSQVFLWDTNIKKKISTILKQDEEIKSINSILEVGVGSGEITRHLLETFPEKKYVGIEIDRNLSLQTSTNHEANIINEDYLKSNYQSTEFTFVFSAVPYHLTTKFIENFITNIKKQRIGAIAFIIQKEAFYRLVDNDRPTFYTFNKFFSLQDKLLIKKQCFKPIPKVDSIFSLWHLNKDLVNTNSTLYLNAIRMFNNKRNKNIRNNIKLSNHVGILPLIKEEILKEKFQKLCPATQNWLAQVGINYLLENSSEDE